jgi:ubiquinone/menaquinone biosynthesis C-methylase UbiE
MTAPSIDQTPQGWDATVEDYERSLAPFFAQFAADALHLVGVQPGHRVLDVAAGPGTLALLAARRGATVVATDFAPGMVERLRQRAGEAGLTNLSAAVMDGQALTLPDSSFYAAFSNFGLIFFPDRAAGFRELYRVVRPGGKAAVAAWSAKPLNIGPIFARAVGRALPEWAARAAPRPALSLQDPDAFMREMGAAGFARVEIHTVVHRSERPNPEAVWEAMRSNPALAGRFPADRLAALRPLFLEEVEAQFGAGPVPLEREAHIGVGTK